MLAAALIVFGLPGAAHAEPVRITSGFLTIYGDGVATMSIHGGDFSAGIVFRGSGSPMVLQLPPTESADLEIHVGVSTTAGVATVGGVRIEDPDHPEGFFTLSAGFAFDLAPFSVVDDPAAEFVSFNPRFTASGVVSGTSHSGESLFTVPVIGSGMASFLLKRIETENGVIFTTLPQLNASFVFDSADAPVPEPTSMLLLGTGLLGVGIRRRRSPATAPFP